MRVAYLVADGEISGGLRVIVQQAEELARRGLAVTLVSPRPQPRWLALKHSRWEQTEFSGSRALLEADIRVATFWTTVAPAIERSCVPVFHLCQGYEADFEFYRSLRGQIRAAYAEPTRKLAIAPHVAERLKTENHTPVTMIGQTFDPEEFPPAHDRRFDTERPAILLIGTVEADTKGVREALDAIGTARARGLKFHLRRISATPIGDDEKTLGLADQHDTGLLPSEMSAAYRSADLFIGPTHAEEGFGLPVLEALSSGLPALLSDTPGHHHIARNAALYFPCGDAAALTASLETVLRDPILRRRLSVLGPIEAKRFRTTDVADRLLAEFESAVFSDGPQSLGERL